ncbi:hypothetical protein CFC21_012860 [Triticum aestivum]|nr:hypothetical protein CFC21_012860 [Triticum aestivum]
MPSSSLTERTSAPDRSATPRPSSFSSMENNHHRQGPATSTPATRSRTRRDPAEDHLYRVPPQDFALTVQRLTGAAPPRTPPPHPPDRDDRQPSPAPPPALSMQEAYLDWCASNCVVLSPGTMAEIDRAARFNSGVNNNNCS